MSTSSVMIPHLFKDMLSYTLQAKPLLTQLHSHGLIVNSHALSNNNSNGGRNRMARRRMISPDIWQDPWFGKLSHTERIFFIGIISNCDDEGRILGEAPFLRSRIFVYEDVALDTIDNMLEKFKNTNSNFCLYSSNGSKYIALKKWSRYQKPEHASPSILPKPPFMNGSGNDSLNGSGNDSPPSIGKVSIGKVSNIYTVWNEQKIQVHKKLTEETKQAIDKALRDNSEEEIIQAIKNYAEILRDDKYFFKYAWTLRDFLRRGLQKFIDGDICRKNYLRDKINGTNQSRLGKVPTKYTRPEELRQ